MNPATIRLAAILALLAVVFTAGWAANGWRWEAKYANLDETYKQFEADVGRLGEEARRHSEVQAALDKAAKEKADAENAKSKSDLAGLYAAYRSLRDNHPGAGIVPAAPAGSPSPDRACFSRAGLDSALRDFDRGVTGLLEQGDRAITDLNTARRWAQNPTGVQP